MLLFTTDLHTNNPEHGGKVTKTVVLNDEQASTEQKGGLTVMVNVGLWGNDAALSKVHCERACAIIDKLKEQLREAMCEREA